MLVSWGFFRVIPSDNTLKQEFQGIGPGRETLCFPQDAASIPHLQFLATIRIAGLEQFLWERATVEDLNS